MRWRLPSAIGAALGLAGAAILVMGQGGVAVVHQFPGVVTVGHMAGWADQGVIKDIGAVPSGSTGANPTATIGTSAVNGTATTFMPSDAAPAIPQCSSSTFGACKVDGSTITATAGVISAAGGSSGISGLTATQVPLAGSATTLTSSFALGTGVQTFLTTPSSANLATALTDETGSGAAVFGTSPALGTPAITGGTLAGITAFGLRDTSAAFDLTLAATSSTALTAGRALTFDVVNAGRTVKLGSNLTIASDPGAVSGAIKSNGTGTFAQAASTDLSDTAQISLLNAVQTATAAKTFGEVHGGLPEAVTLTSNDYVAVAADCGKIKTLPTGTTPTVHLPNLNVGCTITFVTTATISYQFLAASGGSTINSQGFSHTRGTAAGDIVSATIVTNSSSAAKWSIAGDLTS